MLTITRNPYPVTRNPFADLHDDAKRAEWQARFDAQLHHATEDTPTNPKTGQRKHYYRLDAFVRAVIYAQLKASN